MLDIGELRVTAVRFGVDADRVARDHLISPQVAHRDPGHIRRGDVHQARVTLDPDSIEWSRKSPGLADNDQAVRAHWPSCGCR